MSCTKSGPGPTLRLDVLVNVQLRSRGCVGKPLPMCGTALAAPSSETHCGGDETLSPLAIFINLGRMIFAMIVFGGVDSAL